jgi:hypothetical protein
MAALIPLLGAAALYGYYSSNREVELVHATVDGEKYLVLRRPDRASAANLLAIVRRDLESLVAHMHEKNKDDEDCTRLHKKFNPRALSEGAPGAGYTSYTVDKGARVVLCIRQEDGSFVPRNVILYVAIHELAHIMTSSVGHGADFWENNKRLLDAAKEMAIYYEQDFTRTPQPYCGMHISS